MYYLKSWILTLFTSSFICLICEFIILKGELEKIIKTVLNIFLLSSILYPLKHINLKINDIKLNIKEDKIDNKLENRVNKLSEKHIKEKINDFLSKKSVKPKKLNIHIIGDEKIMCEISFEKGDEKILDELKETFQIPFILVD